MKVTYYLAGFDRRTDRIGRYLALPDHIVPAVKDIVGLTPEIAAMWGDWPLTDAMVRDMEPLVGETLVAKHLMWVLEPTAPAKGQEAAAAE